MDRPSDDSAFGETLSQIKEEKTDIRPEYFRDIDRIIHSMNYSRYINKTQVFTKSHNDHVSTRMIHVQLVSKVGIDYYTSQYDDSGVIWKYPRHDFQCAESDEPVYP